MIVAALYFLRHVVPPLAHFGRAERWWFGVHVGLAALGVVIGGVHLSFHDGAARLRKAVGVSAIVYGSFGCIAHLLAAKPLAWIHGEKEGVVAAAAAHRPALIDFYADWCIPCRELDVRTFGDAQLAAELSRFTLVKMNCSSDDDPIVKETTARYRADTLPTVVLLDKDGKVAQKIDRFVTAAELLPLLQQVR
jgi:thiol:disulfide interchange protein DsbD